MREPESTTECLYFSRREIAPGRGKAMAWVFRKECPECHKALMKKPKKTSPTYDCPECGYTEPKKEHEENSELNIKYTCPFCDHKGETTAIYKRKTLYGKPAYIFICDGCGEKVGLYKKMNVPPKFIEKVEAFRNK